jgi:hypothetical protein
MSQTTCPATPAGIGSSRSRWRAAGCERGTRLSTGYRAPADSHRRFRSAHTLRSTRTLFRSLVSC